ncbi:hypothetical protein LENED_003070 [Lentinula edodes]|uniref:Uncharacterized protein n=1 Tax=Lentinula edodes TaxID=5353 RepID=A0A1Q3E2L7_LENED|nr:hypothetical protein LENED_003070 [Lentinula edodes]
MRMQCFFVLRTTCYLTNSPAESGVERHEPDHLLGRVILFPITVVIRAIDEEEKMKRPIKLNARTRRTGGKWATRRCQKKILFRQMILVLIESLE